MPHNPIETQATHSDSDILALLNARREEGLQLLEQRYGKTLFSFARRLVGDRRDAEECLNDVRLDVWNAIPPAKHGVTRGVRKKSFPRPVASGRGDGNAAAKRGYRRGRGGGI